MNHEAGRPDLPAEQTHALRRAVRLEWLTLGYAVVTISVTALVLGSSQAMRTAWIEDMISTVPQLAFLVAVLFVRRAGSARFPYGTHRSMGVGHAVGGVALLVVGGSLAYEAVSMLVAAEHPTIGTVRVFGHTVWLGWFAIAVMVAVSLPPLLYFGPQKKRLATTLHNKLLFADGDMAGADWQTNAASIVGVLGIGVGWWWLDGAAALFISVGIVRDGVRNTRLAVLDLMDERATSCDGAKPEPVHERLRDELCSLPWVAAAALRMRDQGQVFHVEAFVVPRDGTVDVHAMEAAADQLAMLDWRLQEIVIVPVRELPPQLVGDGAGQQPGGRR